MGGYKIIFKADANQPEGVIRWGRGKQGQLIVPPNPRPAYSYSQVLAREHQNWIDETVRKLEESLWADNGPMHAMTEFGATYDSEALELVLKKKEKDES